MSHSTAPRPDDLDAGAVSSDRQAELVQWVDRFAPCDGLHDTAIAGLQLIRASAPGWAAT